MSKSKQPKRTIRELVEMRAKAWAAEKLTDFNFDAFIASVLNDTRRKIVLAVFGIEEDFYRVRLVRDGLIDRLLTDRAKEMMPKLLESIDLDVTKILTPKQLKDLKALMNRRILETLDYSAMSYVEGFVTSRLEESLEPIVAEVYEKLMVPVTAPRTTEEE